MSPSTRTSPIYLARRRACTRVGGPPPPSRTAVANRPSRLVTDAESPPGDPAPATSRSPRRDAIDPAFEVTLSDRRPRLPRRSAPTRSGRSTRRHDRSPERPRRDPPRDHAASRHRSNHELRPRFRRAPRDHAPRESRRFSAGVVRAGVDVVREDLYAFCRTYVRQPLQRRPRAGRYPAHRAPTGDLAVPRHYVDGHGYPPTVREIGEAVGLASPSTVHAHLANLERAGLFRRDPTKPRALELIGPPRAPSRADRSRATSRGSRSSARSRPAGRSSPRRTSRTSSPFRSRSAAVPISSSACTATRWSTPGSSTATCSSCSAATTPGMATSSSRSSGTTRPPTRRPSRRSTASRRPDPAPAGERGARADLRRPRAGAGEGRGGVPEPPMTDARDAFARTLDQELLALVRGVSLECPCCGEFVMRPAARSRVRSAARSSQTGTSSPRSCCRGEYRVGIARIGMDWAAAGRYRWGAGRMTAGGSSGRPVPRKVRTPQGRTLGRSQAAKADGQWNRKETAGGRPPVRVKGWGKSPPATVATRRLAKPRPVQGEAGPVDAARRGTGCAASRAPLA